MHMVELYDDRSSFFLGYIWWHYFIENQMLLFYFKKINFLFWFLKTIGHVWVGDKYIRYLPEIRMKNQTLYPPEIRMVINFVRRDGEPHNYLRTFKLPCLLAPTPHYTRNKPWSILSIFHPHESYYKNHT